MKTLCLLLTLAVTLVSCGKGNSSGSGPERNVNPVLNETGAKAEMSSLVNNHRARLGLPALGRLGLIENEAQGHSQDMSDGRTPFGHIGMPQRCQVVRSRLGGNACGEIVARGDLTAQQAFDGWLRSWGHRNRIEDPRFTGFGIGLSSDRAGRPYWTILFLQQ
ncbi:MAG: CAP domain-containing protein [Bacteriovoracaceae bacterium]|nr:CAP domain-containing protein [Bacteriovoracaceae bacterium]